MTGKLLAFGYSVAVAPKQLPALLLVLHLEVLPCAAGRRPLRPHAVWQGFLPHASPAAPKLRIDKTVLLVWYTHGLVQLNALYPALPMLALTLCSALQLGMQ